MVDVESNFLETRLSQFFIRFRYAEVFFILALKKCFNYFLQILLGTNPILNLHMNLITNIPFLDLNVSFCSGKLKTDVHAKYMDMHNIYITYYVMHPNY